MTPLLPAHDINPASMAAHLNRLHVERDEAELWGHGELAQEQIHLALAECHTRGWVASFRMGDGWTVTEKENA